MVKPGGWHREEGMQRLGPDAPIQCTEMKDNTTHSFQLGDFMQMCLQYLEGALGRGVGDAHMGLQW